MTEGHVRAPYVVVDDFMPSTVALEMRATAEMYLGNPYQHSLKTHANWDYWYVPGLYTYLRTDPAEGARHSIDGPYFETALPSGPRRHSAIFPSDSVISASISMVAGSPT